MAQSKSHLQEQIEHLLQAEHKRGDLLRRLTELAEMDNRFPELAHIWAPALYERDARFFEFFLVHTLSNTWPRPAILRDLANRAEHDGHESLFRNLYLLAYNEKELNKQLLVLARSHEPDEQIYQAVQRRVIGRHRWIIAEDAALALYQRTPARFTPLLREHFEQSTRWWDSGNYDNLRRAARQQGNEDFAWFLFCHTASTQQWEAEILDLIRQQVPAHQILGELEKRHLATDPDDNFYPYLPPNSAVRLLESYGNVVLPYIERYAPRFWGKDIGKLVKTLELLADDATFWRIFFKFHYSDAFNMVQYWNEHLRRLLNDTTLSNKALRAALDLCAPPYRSSGRWPSVQWQLQKDIARALYQRTPALFAPWLQQVQHADLALFQAAEQQHDEEFLDFLTYRMLHQLANMAYRAFRKPDSHFNRYYKWDMQSERQKYDAAAQPLLDRFARLVRESPHTYVRHAAAILSHFEEQNAWSFRQECNNQTPLAYLVKQHHETWRQSPDAMRELLESSNQFVQAIGVEILAEGGANAAWRVRENLPALRALLLGRANLRLKKRTLLALEHAAQQQPDEAAPILSLLEEAMDTQGKRAIDKRAMVSYVRLHHQIQQANVAI